MALPHAERDRFDLCASSACDEVACVKTALGFNKKKPHPLKINYLCEFQKKFLHQPSFVL